MNKKLLDLDAEICRLTEDVRSANVRITALKLQREALIENYGAELQETNIRIYSAPLAPATLQDK